MRLLLILLTLAIAACGSSSGYNPTTFAYQIDQPAVDAAKIKKVILASVNLTTPTRSYLRKGELTTRALVRDYLESNGYEILPDYHFDNAWTAATRSHGGVYDPTSGKINVAAWRAVMLATGENLRNNTDADAVIFADLIEHDVQHSASMQHYARWHGVTRKPDTQGTGDGVPLGFDWTAPIKGASLNVNIYSMDLQRIFASYGGIDTLEAIDLRSSEPHFVRKKKVLNNDSFIEEGIEIAFHPFIVMDDYPGNK